MSNTDNSAAARIRAVKGRAVAATHARDVGTAPSQSADRSGSALLALAYTERINCCGPTGPVDPQGVPMITNVESGDGFLRVFFQLQRSQALYTVTATPPSPGAAISAPGTSSPITVTGLTNGVAYTVGVTYVTSDGTTTESDPMPNKIPVTVPSAPRNLSVIPLDGALDIYFTAPISTGGTPITNYQYTTNSGTSWASLGSTTSPVRVPTLNNGTLYTVVFRAVNSVGEGPESTSITAAPIPSSFTPATIPGINVWLDSHEPSRIGLTSGIVTIWEDRSGNANNFTKTGGTIQYAQPSTINSRPAINFVSAPGTYLGKDNFNIAPTNQLTLFMVVRQNGRVVANNSELFFTRNDYHYFDLFSNTGPTTPTKHLSLNIGNAIQVSSNRQFLDPSRNVLMCVTVGTTANIYLNGIQTNTNIYRGSLSLNNATLDWAISGGGFKGDIGEVITYPSELSSADREKVEGYLAWKWGLLADLPGSHPYYSAPPTSTFAAPVITNIVAGTRSLTVQFTHNVGTYTVTNYKYSTDNGSTYRTIDPVSTTSPLVLTDGSNGVDLVNGSSYSVIIKAVTATEESPVSNIMQATPVVRSRTSFTTVGSTEWNAPPDVYAVEYLVVGGGGGGGGSYDTGAGGGGGGGLALTGIKRLTPSSVYNITVGAGGTGGTGTTGAGDTDGVDGEASSFDTISALGGGGGKQSRTGRDGSGGAVGNAATLTAPTGGNGGRGAGGTTNQFGGGGGGGMGSAGTTAIRLSKAGGTGIGSALSGSSVTYSAGGNGGARNADNDGLNGTANRGNGGEGGSSPSFDSSIGGNGGSGIVIIVW